MCNAPRRDYDVPFPRNIIRILDQVEQDLMEIIHWTRLVHKFSLCRVFKFPETSRSLDECLRRTRAPGNRYYADRWILNFEYLQRSVLNTRNIFTLRRLNPCITTLLTRTLWTFLWALASPIFRRLLLKTKKSSTVRYDRHQITRSFI